MDIVPLITQKCAISGCHTNGAAIGNFNEYSAIKTRIDNGKFQLMVFDLELMPPATASPISFDERMKLKKWVDQGAINN